MLIGVTQEVLDRMETQLSVIQQAFRAEVKDAVDAERERCARVADMFADSAINTGSARKPDEERQSQCDCLSSGCARAISERIRSGK